MGTWNKSLNIKRNGRNTNRSPTETSHIYHFYTKFEKWNIRYGTEIAFSNVNVSSNCRQIKRISYVSNEQIELSILYFVKKSSFQLLWKQKYFEYHYKKKASKLDTLSCTVLFWISGGNFVNCIGLFLCTIVNDWKINLNYTENPKQFRKPRQHKVRKI